MSLVNLIKMVNEIKQDYLDKTSNFYTTKTTYENDIRETYKEEVVKYPAIISLLFNQTLSEDSFDRLDFMLQMATKVYNKDIVEHDASVVVGQRLVDDIVKPQLNNSE